jgi:hypothetical protein
MNLPKEIDEDDIKHPARWLERMRELARMSAQGELTDEASTPARVHEIRQRQLQGALTPFLVLSSTPNDPFGISSQLRNFPCFPVISSSSDSHRPHEGGSGMGGVAGGTAGGANGATHTLPGKEGAPTRSRQRLIRMKKQTKQQELIQNQLQIGRDQTETARLQTEIALLDQTQAEQARIAEQLNMEEERGRSSRSVSKWRKKHEVPQAIHDPHMGPLLADGRPDMRFSANLTRSSRSVSKWRKKHEVPQAIHDPHMGSNGGAAIAPSATVTPEMQQFISITSADVLAAAYYIEGAERRGLGVDQAVSHYFERGCMAPPPNWTPTSKPAATTQPATPVTQTQPAKVRSVSEEEREVD